MTAPQPLPKLLILNQMAGPMTWELAEDAGRQLGQVALLTGHPDTLAKGSTPQVQLSPAPSYRRGSFLTRALSWLAYLLAAFFWLWRFPARLPLLLFSNPPILCWLGWLMWLLRRQPYAVMVHDIYPDIFVRMRRIPESHPLIRLWRWLNRKAYENARVVMTLGECMAANLEKQFDSAHTPAGRVQVIYPWVDTDRIRPISKEENWFAREYHQVGKLTVMYSGNMGLGHDLETMLEAACLLQGEPRLHFMFIGSGPKWSLVQQCQARYNLPNLTLLGWQPEEVLPYSLATADVTLISLEQGITGLAVPSKAIYALAAGSALVLLSSAEGELAEWLNRMESGLVVPSPQPQQVADHLQSWLQDDGFLQAVRERARRSSLEYFSREKNFLQLYRVLIRNLNLSE